MSLKKFGAFFVEERIEMVLIYGECERSVMGLPLKWIPSVFLTVYHSYELHFIVCKSVKKKKIRKCKSFEETEPGRNNEIGTEIHPEDLR